MNDSIEIFADLTVYRENREISIKADGKTIKIYLQNLSSLLRVARHLGRMLGRSKSLETLDRVLSSTGLSVALHVGRFHVVLMGAGASRFFRSVLVFSGMFRRMR
jgi:hypothetical protein